MLGEKIRARRKELGWSMRELGLKCGLSASFLCDLERGKRSVSADNLQALGQVLGLPLDQLMGVSSERPTNGIPVDLPKSLMRFAQDADLPFRQVMCCYWLVRTVMDHRQPHKREGLEAFDWARFYETVKDFL